MVLLSICTAFVASPIALAQNQDDRDGASDILSAPADRPASIIPGPYIAPGSVRYDLFGNEPVGDSENEGVVRLGDQRENNNTQDFVIESDELDALDPASIGLQEYSGFPFEMWRGTSYESALSIVRSLPAATRSPNLNALVMKFVLASAAIPEGDVNIDSDAQQTENSTVGIDLVDRQAPKGLLEARLSVLARSGQFGLLGQLLSLVPADYQSSELRSLQADYALITGDTISACEIANDAREEAGAVRWLKILAYCSALEGDLSATSFHLNLLAETNDASPEFSRLINKVAAMAMGDDRLRGGIASVRQGELSPLMMALLANTGEEISLDEIKDADGMIISAFVRRADIPIDLRAEIGASAVQRGLLSFETYAEIVRAMDFTVGEQNSIDLLAETVDGSRVNNLLIDAAWNAQNDAEQTKYIEWAWSRARASGEIASVLAPLDQFISAMEKSAEAIPFALMGARSAFYVGKPNEARDWYDLTLSRAAVGSRQAVLAAVNMWPMMIINDIEKRRPFSENILKRWRRGLDNLPIDVQLERAGLFYAMLDVFGYEVPQDMWIELATYGDGSAADQGKSPRHSAWRSFLKAAQQGRYAETLGLGIIIVGADGPAHMSVSSLTSVLATLKDMGLEAEARALAVEAMISAGF